MFSDTANNAGAASNTAGPLRPPRHTEYSDTHQTVHRQDPDWNRKKRKNAEQDNQESPDDDTSISIDAVILLLNGMLGKATTKTMETPDQKAQAATMRLNTLSKPYVNYAANAYEHAAEITPEQRQRRAARNYTRDRLNTALESFSQLKNKGITSIHIEKNGDFLTSIEKAADMVLL